MHRIKNINVFLLLLVVLSLNSLRDINIAQALVVLGFMAIMAYHKHLENSKKPDQTHDLQNQINALRDRMSGLAVKDVAASQRPNEIKRFF